MSVAGIVFFLAGFFSSQAAAKLPAAAIISEVRADLNGDGKTDHARLIADESQNIVYLKVDVSNATDLLLLTAPHNANSVRMKLQLRSSGDPRCYAYAVGGTCGQAVDLGPTLPALTLVEPGSRPIIFRWSGTRFTTALGFTPGD